MKAITAGEMIALLQKVPADTPLVISTEGDFEYYAVYKKQQKLIKDHVYFEKGTPSNVNNAEDDDGNAQPIIPVFQIAKIE